MRYCVNPGILNFRDLWLLQTIQNLAVSSIFVDKLRTIPQTFHTDFYEFLPEAANWSALLKMSQHKNQIG